MISQCTIEQWPSANRWENQSSEELVKDPITYNCVTQPNVISIAKDRFHLIEPVIMGSRGLAAATVNLSGSGAY